MTILRSGALSRGEAHLRRGQPFAINASSCD
jgi:hypothetical protein